VSEPTPRILLIEDNPDHAYYIQKGLAREGFEVTWVEEGPSALVEARDNPPAAIVLDIMLPQIHGLDVLRELKTDKRTVGIPVIVVTAYATLQLNREREMAVSYGATDFFRKPFKVADLAAKLREILMIAD
jgi:DNA-binding response OmpR family regulator